MVATAADTPAALVSRSRASSSWVTNSSCFEASGPTRACEGPVSMAASCRWAEAAMAESWRREVTRSGPAVWGSSSTAWTWVMNVEPTAETVPAAVLRDRTDRTCRPMTGTMVMGVNRGDERSDWAASNSARAVSSRCTDPAEVSWPGVRSALTCSRLASPRWSWR